MYSRLSIASTPDRPPSMGSGFVQGLDCVCSCRGKESWSLRACVAGGSARLRGLDMDLGSEICRFAFCFEGSLHFE